MQHDCETVLFREILDICRGMSIAPGVPKNEVGFLTILGRKYEIRSRDSPPGYCVKDATEVPAVNKNVCREK
jgi:hypothetical protein